MSTINQKNEIWFNEGENLEFKKTLAPFSAFQGEMQETKFGSQYTGGLEFLRYSDQKEIKGLTEVLFLVKETETHQYYEVYFITQANFAVASAINSGLNTSSSC